MTRVLGFAFGAAFAITGAWLTRASGGLPFWLFVVGAAGFTFAAVLQLLGVRQAE